MILLLIHLLDEDSSTDELFQEFMYEQSIVRNVDDRQGNRVKKSCDLRLISANDFLTVLKQKKIIKSQKGVSDL